MVDLLSYDVSYFHWKSVEMKTGNKGTEVNGVIGILQFQKIFSVFALNCKISPAFSVGENKGNGQFCNEK